MLVTAMRNVLITGTPRSGTTLLCSLLNKLPDTVALHEPMNVWNFPNCPDANAVADSVEKFCTETRQSLHEHGYALSKHVGGHIPDNVAADQLNARGTRLRHTEHGPVFVNKPLSENFVLAIKHPVAFSALLETLNGRFECVAIIRNPLATLASWNSLAWLNVRRGHAPIGEKLDPKLRSELAAEPDTIERQLHILEWFYTRFSRILPDKAIIKYEDLIASHGRELAKFFPGAADFEEKLSSKNVNKFYDRALMAQLGQKLLQRNGVFWDFYSKRDVENLMTEASSSAPAALVPNEDSSPALD
jgi:Sulfotransferase family